MFDRDKQPLNDVKNAKRVPCRGKEIGAATHERSLGGLFMVGMCFVDTCCVTVKEKEYRVQ